MNSIETHIERLQAKLKQLIKQHEALLKENSLLCKQVEALKLTENNAWENINTLQQQNLLLKASVSNMEAADKKKLEAQINNYLKNIENCISLLSE